MQKKLIDRLLSLFFQNSIRILLQKREERNHFHVISTELTVGQRIMSYREPLIESKER